ncbi:MAG: carotenoid 1,2-hydratase [Myxococcota bacterium]
MVSEDRAWTLVFIAMLGSVFSPRYARARRRHGPQATDPLDFLGLSAVLYGPGRRRWCLSERGQSALDRSAAHLRLGPSSLRVEDGSWHAEIQEPGAPFGAGLSGHLRLDPVLLGSGGRALSASGLHRWWPMAPMARAEVELSEPKLRFRGAAYLDANVGQEPLEAGFEGWSWARVHGQGAAAIVYEATDRQGQTLLAAERFGEEGASTPPLSLQRLGRTAWGLEERLRLDQGSTPSGHRRLEDTPFYARSSLSASILGVRGTAVSESLSLARFRRREIQALLGFRARSFR